MVADSHTFLLAVKCCYVPLFDLVIENILRNIYLQEYQLFSDDYICPYINASHVLGRVGGGGGGGVLNIYYK